MKRLLKDKKNSRKDLKSIRTIIRKNTISILTIAILLISGCAIMANYFGTINLLEKNMTVTAQIAADDVSSKLEGYLNMISELAYDSTFDTDYVNAEDIICRNRLERFVKRNGFISATYCDANGLCSNGSDVSKEQYFIDSKTNLKPEVADLIISKETGELSTVFTAPIVKDDLFKGMIIVVGDATILSDLVKQINIGKTGSGYIINKNGDIIAHNDIEKVLEQHNPIELSKKNPSYKKIASIQQKMIRGEKGFEQYYSDGKRKIESYAPILNSNGWSIGVSASSFEFTQSIYLTVFIIILITLAILYLVNLAVRKMAGIITAPITLCTDRIKLLSGGDLTTEIPTITSQEEGAILAAQIAKTIEELHNVITDIKYCLKRMSEGNFDISITREYSGDFAPIKIAILDIVNELNNTLRQIQNSSESVAKNSNQVLEGAQFLSEGATGQAISVSKVNNTINNITLQIESNSKSAQNATEMVNNAREVIEQGKTQMMEVVQYMHQIDEASTKISYIIKEIEEIADQTNLLALNAAIEAARAGEAGKGFTVIAENVGQLAAKSAQATKTTTELISNTIYLSQNGNKIADNATESLGRIIEATSNITEYVNKITGDSMKQAQAMGKVSKEVEEISAIVEENAATAEESSAISEQLTDQMNHLNDLVMKFSLKEV
ncbi:methyl-accepting chemotaxis protein [Mobilisporobacter senegalensis]|uniref:Methyl-accepting chemotaxis protein n=1 Tax=Mobilisporobacter senegalensis TaxID=1329262 RepID=A0A3N1XLE2_9FIRM|nr:methyl-accepting chemotaxis protein [Mobilisporobacter senegalensis]ROR27519.1 methyl-accepting chemotaxis protein [Mobilisporobacter senegalensis]